MSSIAISVGAFALLFGGALLGTFLGARLPKHHLSDENKEVARLAMALVGTLTGITLGLLIGSAKTFYDTQSNELTQASSNVALLGRLLQLLNRFQKPLSGDLCNSLNQRHWDFTFLGFRNH